MLSPAVIVRVAEARARDRFRLGYRFTSTPVLGAQARCGGPSRFREVPKQAERCTSSRAHTKAQQ